MPTISGGGSFTGGVTIILPSATGRVPTPGNSNVVVNAWDLDYAIPESNTSQLWDVTTGLYVQAYNLSSDSGDTGPRGLYIGNSGQKLYATANGADRIWEWDLTKAYDVTTASYVQSLNTNSYQTNNRSVTFKPDGTKMYTVGYADDTADQYDLSDAYNVASATHVTDFSVATQEANPEGIEFKPDGTKMFVIGTSGDDINEYALSTAWDLSTASFTQASISLSGTETAPRGMAFKPDGTSVWVVGINSDSIDQYDMSTPWDVSTISYGNKDLVVGNNPESVVFKPDGSYFYVIQGASVSQYVVGMKTFDLNSTESNPHAVFFKPDGTKMYVTGQNGDDINEYDLSSAWDVETASLNQTQSISAQDSSPTGLYIKSDGTTLYMAGTAGDDINEYTLSTPWDISTLSYVRNFGVSAKETNPEGVHFKSDGTKMYICGNSSDSVHEYDLSTAWNISTASFNQSYSVSSDIVNPTGLRFKSDGTKMFVVGRGTNDADEVNEYALTSAWDISTASFSKKINVPDNTPNGLDFKTDGEKMYVVGSANDKVYQYEFT